MYAFQNIARAVWHVVFGENDALQDDKTSKRLKSFSFRLHVANRSRQNIFGRQPDSPLPFPRKGFQVSGTAENCTQNCIGRTRSPIPAEDHTRVSNTPKMRMKKTHMH